MLKVETILGLVIVTSLHMGRARASTGESYCIDITISHNSESRTIKYYSNDSELYDLLFGETDHAPILITEIPRTIAGAVTDYIKEVHKREQGSKSVTNLVITQGKTEAVTFLLEDLQTMLRYNYFSDDFTESAESFQEALTLELDRLTDVAEQLANKTPRNMKSSTPPHNDRMWELRELTRDRLPDHREAIRSKLTEMGVRNMTSLEISQHGEMEEFLKTLPDPKFFGADTSEKQYPPIQRLVKRLFNI